MTLAAPSSAPGQQPGKIRVLIVDDSSVVRAMMRRWLTEEADIDMVGMAIDGEDGVAKAAEFTPDVVVLDIEMPRMDGLTALPQILKAAPRARVLMASTLTQRAARVTLEALSKGASDYLAKPDNARMTSAEDYRRDLCAKIRALGGAAVRARQISAPRMASTTSAAATPAGQNVTPAKATGPFRPKVLVIGSSTGGPEALRQVVTALAGKVRVPILITQHMPPHFTKILAEHLARIHPAPVVEAEDGMPVKAGQIYVAPGDFHMTVRQRGASMVVKLDQRPPINFCRPAVDPLFQSAVEVFGGDVLAVVLTGMGHDGRDGALGVQRAGGRVIAQDESSSVVWGMPGAVARAGAAHAILPLDKVAGEILKLLEGRG